jgi:hypothetical protein
LGYYHIFVNLFIIHICLAAYGDAEKAARLLDITLTARHP